MIICKDLDINNTINSVDEWLEKCPPMGKEKHWRKGRSAMETANIWIHGAPSKFVDLMKPIGVQIDLVSPEYNTHFDNYSVNTRNNDLIILDNRNKALIGIESKVDEPFNDILEKRINKAELELLKRPKSKALNRIEDLCHAVLGREKSNCLKLRYQLLYSVAGVIAEANRYKFSKAVFVVQVIKTNKINLAKYKTNQEDLDLFVNTISNDKYKSIKNGELLLIGKLPGNEFIPNNVDLYIGKIEINI